MSVPSYIPWREKMLLYRLYDKDPEAFGELYDIYAPRIYRFIFFKVSSRTTAEDLTAEVFLKSWEYVQRREKRIAHFRAFIYRLARNAIIDHYRGQVQREFSGDYETLDRVATPGLSAAAEALKSSDLATIELALRGLKDEYRDVIILKYIEDYPTHEIAKIMDKSKGAVRVTVHRALEALREEVEKLEETNV